jgi:predicted alpha/beta hydrolase family esterase
MKKQVLFIHGGGDNGYEADTLLADSLKATLGSRYEVSYPELKDDNAPDLGWPNQIGQAIHAMQGDLILAGHSLGASMILKYLSEALDNIASGKVTGVFLVATPFWNGDEDWVKGLMLQPDFADKLPQDLPLFMYHSKDDEVAPFEHLSIYIRKLPHAQVRTIPTGGHQFNNDLTLVAKDIQQLQG